MLTSRSPRPVAPVSIVAAASTSIARVIEGAEPPVRSTQAVPEAKIQSIVAPIFAMMSVVVTGCDQPIACAPLDQPTGEQLPPHVVGDAHHCHDQQHH